MEKYGFDEEQAQAITDMRSRAFTILERAKRELRKKGTSKKGYLYCVKNNKDMDM